MKIISALPLLAALSFPFAQTGCNKKEEATNSNVLLVKKENNNELNKANNVLPQSVKPQEKEAAKKVEVVNDPPFKGAVVRKDKMPELFKSFDINNDGKIDPFEALEFFQARRSSKVNFIDSDWDGFWSKEEIYNVRDWFNKVAFLKDTTPEEKEMCLDVAAMLHKFMLNKEKIQEPLPIYFARFDENKDNTITLNEAIKIYEKVKDKKLERNGNGELTSTSFREMVEAFRCPPSFGIETYPSTSYSMFTLTRHLKEEYAKRFGPYPEEQDNRIIIR